MPRPIPKCDRLNDGSAVTTGLTIGFQSPLRLSKMAQVSRNWDFVPDMFIRIAPDSTVTIVASPHVPSADQRHDLATIIVEELDADWSQIRVHPAPADPELYRSGAFNIQETSSGMSIPNSWDRCRQAAATARAMLVAAAAQRFELPAEAVSVEKGICLHRMSGRWAVFGDLTETAATLRLPSEVTIKNPASLKAWQADHGAQSGR